MAINSIICLGLLVISLTYVVEGLVSSDSETVSFSQSHPRSESEWVKFHSNYQNKEKCGYESCNPVKPGAINVHLVPHTHDDVGWLKTVDQYYYGSKKQITPTGVQYILDSVVQELSKDPRKRFIYVEIAFFKRWWYEQTDDIKQTVTSLVNQGRLEFILGGWSMNDEAATHYNAIIDQHTLGFQFLNETFGDCARPRVAWQIDPFGHSREMASLFAQMGFDGLFNGRIDYQDKWKRLRLRSMEMVWRGSPRNLGKASDLFTGTLYNTYAPPSGFCFDVFCRDDPIMDDPRLHDYNVNERVEAFISEVNTQSKHYQTDHIVMTMGEDFNYVNANSWYKNLDKLIKYVNERQTNGSRINLLYSTPSCYLYQLHRSNVTWPTKTDDFLPYAHRPHSYWTGYFTSRPTHKRFSRYGNNILQAVKQMSVFGHTTGHTEVSLIETLREAMGVVQHHDAITGTAKQAVADDYAERMSRGIASGQKALSFSYNQLIHSRPSSKSLSFVYCNLLNISVCRVSESDKPFVVVLYNPLARPVSDIVRLPVTYDGGYVVQNATGHNVTSEVMAVPPWIQSIPERRSRSSRQLLFPAHIPSLGFSTYFIKHTKKNRHEGTNKDQLHDSKADIVISNEYLSLAFDGSTNNLKSIHNLDSGINMSFTVVYGYYMGMPGNNKQSRTQASGAYVFRPLEQTPTTFLHPTIKVIKTALVQEVWQTYSPWIHHVLRLHRGARNVEVQWTVGPIPIKDNRGKEIVVRYVMPDLKNKGLFYTDSNGREMITRQRNFRPTWELFNSEPVSGNYFPVNSRIYMQDKDKKLQLTVLTDRSQGGSSLKDGHIELMLHRRLLHDDGLGVGEALNETGSDGRGLIVTGKHFIIMADIKKSASLHRDLALRTYLAPVLSFVPDVTRSYWTRNYVSTWSALVGVSLRPNVHLLTLEMWRDGSCLVRFEHIYEKGEDEELSQPVDVNLQHIFRTFHVLAYEELTLGANLRKSDLHRLQWRTRYSDAHRDDTLRYAEKMSNNFTITLSPMQIRTFRLTIKTLPP